MSEKVAPELLAQAQEEFEKREATLKGVDFVIEQMTEHMLRELPHVDVLLNIALVKANVELTPDGRQTYFCMTNCAASVPMTKIEQFALGGALRKFAEELEAGTFTFGSKESGNAH